MPTSSPCYQFWQSSNPEVKWPSGREPISKIGPSDGCGRMEFPGRWTSGINSTNLDVIWEMSAYTYLVDSIMPHPSLLECLQGAAHIIAGDALSYEEGEEFLFNYLVEDRPG